MQTQHSFTFQARRYYPAEDIGSPNLSVMVGAYPCGPFIMSAGRWSSHGEAAYKAADWLKAQADISPQQYALEVVQVEELELCDG